MNTKLIHFTGDNYEEVLAVIPGYIRCKRYKIEFHIFVPFKGDLLIKKSCYIIITNNETKVVYD